MANQIKSITLTENDQATLKNILQQSTGQARKYLRAKILLLKADHQSNEYIAQKLDISVPTVRLCLQKYQAGGIENALNDCKGRGRKAEISEADILFVINKACQKPAEFGLGAELWYPASFTRFIRSIAEKEGHPRLKKVSEYALRQILKNAKIRPFKVSYYCEKRDPNFDSKMHDLLVIYKQVSFQFDQDGSLLPFEEGSVHTLSYDEKPGIQVIASKGEDRPPKAHTNNSTFMRDYEYIRHGTLSLLAAIDLLSGEAIPLVSSTHKSADFVHFLNKLDEKYPKEDKIRLILDNHSAHTSKETQGYLNTVPGRFDFVFTPTHGSWLNLIEGFFSKLTKQLLHEIRVSDKEELTKRIYQYFEQINQVPVPYRWSYKIDEIDLEKEDIDQIVYEVVNHKAASAENKEKRAPVPIQRGRKNNRNDQDKTLI